MNLGRAFGVLLLISGFLSADVVILKDGRKVSGRVVDKGVHVEVTTEAGLRTFTSDEVEQILTSPKELLGDSDKVFEDAKKDYGDALALADAEERNAKLKSAIEKVRSVRETVTSTRELFPEDKYADLDLKLMQTMQLMRLLRERVSVDVARKPEMINPRRPAPAAVPLPQAFALLLDSTKRATARDTFRAQRAESPETYDLSTAAMLFCARSDAEWRLQAGALKILQEYFAKPWLKDAATLTPAAHLEAAAWLAAQVAALRRAEPSANVDAIALFVAGHLGHAGPGPEAEKTARAMNFGVQNGVPGTAEGHVVRDLNAWISAGDFDLAVLAWVKEYREVDTPAVRYVWSYALIRLAQLKKKGFDRAVSALGTVQSPVTAVREHTAALAKSVKTAALCPTCAGEGKLRCTNCQGVQEIRFPCQKCGGKGKYLPPGLVQPPDGGRRRMFGPQYMTCLPCKGSGIEKLIRCGKCKEGFMICRQCDGKEKTPPEMSDLCESTPCADCEGDGNPFRGIRWACPSCLGLGQKLAPKADPAKILP